MLDIEVAAHTAKAVGLTQFLPAVGHVNGAAKLFGIDECFDQHDRVGVALLPVGAQALEGQAQGTGTQIGTGFVGQEQEAAVIDEERQAAAALLFGPADPAIPRAQPA